jgi:hypothetical protein
MKGMDFPMSNKLSAGEMKELILSRLSHNLSVDPNEATDQHFYAAIVMVVRDLLRQNHQHDDQTSQAGHCGLFFSPRSGKNLIQYGNNNANRRNLKNQINIHH